MGPFDGPDFRVRTIDFEYHYITELFYLFKPVPWVDVEMRRYDKTRGTWIYNNLTFWPTGPFPVQDTSQEHILEVV